MVHDCGTPVNPMLVEAQLQGGVVHGLGQAFSEHLVYDRETARYCPVLSWITVCRVPTMRRPLTSSASCGPCRRRPIRSAPKPSGRRASRSRRSFAVNAVLDVLRPLWGIRYIDAHDAGENSRGHRAGAELNRGGDR